MPERSRRRSDAFDFVLLGAGAVVTELHLPALRALGALQRTRVLDPSAEAATRIEQLFPGVKAQRASFDVLARLDGIADPARTVAVVAVPNHLHAAAVTAALQRGLHVLCEKPLALESQACAALGALAETQQRALGVAMARRYLPGIAALKAALADSMIGELRSVEVEHGGAYAWPVTSAAPFEARNGGVLADMGVHYLDLIESLFGVATPVSYQDDCRGGVEANCELRLELAGGVPVRMALSRTHRLSNRWLVRGSEGELELGVDEVSSCTLRSARGSKLRSVLHPAQAFDSGAWPETFASCFIEQLEDFCASILDGRAPRVAADEAARTASLIEWAYAHRPARTRATGSEARPELQRAPVVVTGATGFIGQHLVERLVDLGFSDLRTPIRSFRSCAGLARFPVRLAQVDLRQRGEVLASMRGARYVFHLAYGRDGSDAARVTTEGTRNVIDAAIASNVECVVVLSTMYVFGHPDTDQPVDESFPYAPTGGEYGRSKMRMERDCLARAKRSGSTRIVVLNPACVFGPLGGAYTALPADLAREGRFCWVEGGRGVANYTYVDNLVDAMLLAARTERAHGERLLITDGDCSWRELLEPMLGSLAAAVPDRNAHDVEQQPDLTPASLRAVARHLVDDLELIDLVNRTPVLGPLKRTLFRRAPRVHSALMQARQSGPAPAEPAAPPAPHPPRWLLGLYGPTSTRFTSKKARELLGWTPLVTRAEGQRRSLAWLKATRALRSED